MELGGRVIHASFGRQSQQISEALNPKPFDNMSTVDIKHIIEYGAGRSRHPRGLWPPEQTTQRFQ